MGLPTVLRQAPTVGLAIMTAASSVQLAQSSALLFHSLIGTDIWMTPAVVASEFFRWSGVFLVLLAATYWVPVAVRKLSAQEVL